MERHLGKLVIVFGVVLLILGVLGGIFITIQHDAWAAKSAEVATVIEPIAGMTTAELQALGAIGALVPVISDLGGAVVLITAEIDNYLAVAGFTFGVVVGLAGIGVIIVGLMLDRLVGRLLEAAEVTLKKAASEGG